MTVKRCPKCGEMKPLSAYYTKYSACKACILAEQRAYRQVNAARIKERKRQYYERVDKARREAKRAAARPSKAPIPPGYKECTACHAQKLLQEFHRNRTRADGHVSHCKVCVKIHDDKYRAEHGDRVVARVNRWRKANPEKLASAAADWGHRRRARIEGSPEAPNDFTAAQWRELVAYFNGACAYCLRADLPLVREHMTPLLWRSVSPCSPRCTRTR